MAERETLSYERYPLDLATRESQEISRSESTVLAPRYASSNR